MFELTVSQKKAIKRVGTGANIFLTGGPGTGKTATLQMIIDEAKKNEKKVCVAGSTGVAASNFLEGRTLHSLLGWRDDDEDESTYENFSCSEKIKNADIVIVDEVSMLNESILKHFVCCLEQLKKQPQIIMCGDFGQLPSPGAPRYPFESLYWSWFNFISCYLTEVVRQKDIKFILMLNKVRNEDASCLPYFNQCCNHKFNPDAITVCTRNDDVREENLRRVKQLMGPGMHTFYATGEIEDAIFDEVHAIREFKAVVGMRVMSIKNDPSGKYMNGWFGTIQEIKPNAVKVLFDKGKSVWITSCGLWVPKKDSTGKKSNKKVKVEQLPLVYGYATTVHKVQGQTFDAVNLVLRKCWEAGQLYVALSRAKSLEGIYLKYPITKESLKTDPRVKRFYEDLYRQSLMVA